MDRDQSPIIDQIPSQSVPVVVARSIGAFFILIIASAVGSAMLVGFDPTPSPAFEIQPSHFLASQDPVDEPASEPIADPESGIQECIVTLVSGRRITGEFIRQDSLIVVIGINGIETTFQRKKVSAVTLLASVAQRYHEMRGVIDDDDIDARLSLVEWLRARKAYALAITELDSILLVDPKNPQGRLLHTWLTEYDKLGANRSKRVKESTNTGSTGSPKNKSKPARKSRKPVRNSVQPLNSEQINLMRVYEIDLRNPPKLKVPDETLRTLMLRNPNAFSPNENERKAIFKLPEVEKLKYLFSLKARDLYAQVIVFEDPAAIKSFKIDVHSQRGWIMNACATTRCHGGVDSGRFQLINSRPNSNETVYTNLYTIDHYVMDDGSPLIDYESPERSRLLQMGMVEKNALYPHPKLPKGFRGSGVRSIFRSTRDRKYRDAIDWIRSMYQPRPEYGFEYPIQAEPNQTELDPADSSDSSPSQPAP